MECKEGYVWVTFLCEPGFNRDIVECKDELVRLLTQNRKGFNRDIVECKEGHVYT